MLFKHRRSLLWPNPSLISTSRCQEGAQVPPLSDHAPLSVLATFSSRLEPRNSALARKPLRGRRTVRLQLRSPLDPWRPRVEVRLPPLKAWELPEGSDPLLHLGEMRCEQ